MIGYYLDENNEWVICGPDIGWCKKCGAKIRLCECLMEINFIIGRRWEEEDRRLCCYTWFNNQVHFGTLEDAKELAKKISDEEGKEYQVYIIPLAQ